MKLSTSVKTFLFLLLIIIGLGVGGWYAWRAWTWPAIKLSNGWELHIARRWKVLDVHDVPAPSRPLLLVEGSKNSTEEKFSIEPRATPAVTTSRFILDMTALMKSEQGSATVLGQGFLQPKDSTVPYVLLQGNGHELLAAWEKKDNQTYYFLARYPQSASATFGREVLASMRSLR